MRGLVPESIDTMEEVWGVRHCVVHNGGRATRDFVRRHPEMGLVAGQLISLDEDFSREDAVDSVTRFVECADEFISARVRSAALRKSALKLDKP